MTSQPATKQDIDGLKKENRLLMVAVPVVVAVITIIGGLITAHKQSGFEKELAMIRSQVEVSNKVMLEKNSTYGRMVAEDEVNFFKKAKSVLGDVDSAFQAESYFARSKKNKKLAELLDALRILTTEPPDTIEAAVIVSLTRYREFVVTNWLAFDNPGTDDSKRRGAYAESANILKTARQNLSDSAKRTTSGK
jgi:hypothetical protein